MIVSVAHVDVRAAVTNLLIRREFSGEEWYCAVKISVKPMWVAIRWREAWTTARSSQEEAPQPSPSTMIREYLVASSMILLVSASLTKEVDRPIKMLSLAIRS